MPLFNTVSICLSITNLPNKNTKTNSTVYIYTVTVRFCILYQWYGHVYGYVYDLNGTVEKPSKIAVFS